MVASLSPYRAALIHPVAFHSGREPAAEGFRASEDPVGDGKPTGRPGEVPSDQKVQQGSTSEKTSNEKKPSATGNEKKKPSAVGEELSESEERQVRELKQRDQEVRAHEQAHATAGGSYASAPSYEYTVGPDGKRYATSGEVKIDASPVRDNPKATIRKMEIVIRAALAPAEPSSQDLQVARQAQETRSQAQAQLAKQAQGEGRDTSFGARSPLAFYVEAQERSTQIAGAIFSASA